MDGRRASAVRLGLLVVLIAVAALSVASLFTDAVPDGVVSLVFGGGMLAWFGTELRRGPEKGERRLLIVGAVAGGLLALGAVLELAGL